MPLFIDTRGKTSVAIGVCDRCKMKRPLVALGEDHNAAGLQVCRDRGCSDAIDPYRLPARRSENITLRRPRPDEPLTS